MDIIKRSEEIFVDLSGPRKGWRYTGQLPGKAVLEADGILRSMEEDGDLEEVLNQCPDCSQTVNVSHLPPYSKIQCPHCGSSVRIRTMMGQYQITGVLGEGGMSQVFKAVDTHLQREVALKILHQALTQDKALTAMFEREAKLTASILHPNVVKVYTVGKEQGYFFIAMELVNAISLDQLIYNKGALSESEVLSIAHDVTSGLRAAHDQSLIHRDIKPGNMLVTEDGTAKLVDFGLAVQQGREDESEDLWATPFYVPPEKLEGEADTYLGDIYSLGATLFHALAGKPPFDANTSSLEELREIKKADLDLKGEAKGISKPTLKLVQNMMAYRAADRPASYEEIQRHIEEIEQRQHGAAPRRRSSSGGSKKKLALIGGGVLVCAILAAVIATRSGSDAGAGSGGIGIIGVDRVISEGDSTNTEKFLLGRNLVGKGEFKRAKPVFDALANEDQLPSLSRMWSLWFQGVLAMLEGNEESARESFASLGEIDDGDEEGSDEIGQLLRRMSPLLADPLPVIGAADSFEAKGVASLGLFASGLKNWQLGQFDSAIDLFKEFESVDLSGELSWAEGLEKAVAGFEADYELWKSLPNPSRRRVGDLDAEEAELKAALGELKSKGAFPMVVKSRLRRIDEIRKRMEEEKESPASQPRLPEMTLLEEGEATTVASPSLSSAASEERKRIVLLVSEFDSLRDTLLFAGFSTRLQAETFFTPEGKQWHSDLVGISGDADRFLTVLAELLDSKTYEGEILRRKGVPLQGSITAASPTVFVVDLDFGPNDVDVEIFDPVWMIRVAEELLGPATAESVQGWRAMAAFSMAIGEIEEATRLADAIRSLDAPFADSLRRISEVAVGVIEN